MQVELKRIQQEVGITFIYVTHDQEEAMTMSDRIAVMNKGRYEQLGDPESLYERPTTRFVAGFLGHQQPAPRRRSRARTAGYATVRLGDDTIVRAPSAPRRWQPTAISVGVRPEKIRLRDDRTRRRPTGTTSCTASSATRSYLGVSTQYQVEARGRCPPDRLRAERRARHPRRAVGAGRGGPADLVTRPQLRRRGSTPRPDDRRPSLTAADDHQRSDGRRPP